MTQRTRMTQKTKAHKSKAKRAVNPPPKKEGKKKPYFKVSPVTLADLEWADDLEAEEEAPQGEARYKLFLEVQKQVMAMRTLQGAEDKELSEAFKCRCENIPTLAAVCCFCTAVRCISAQMDQHGLSPGTIAVYLQQMMNQHAYVGEKLTREELEVFHRFRGIFERRYAEQKKDSGTAVSTEDAHRLFELLEGAGHGLIAAALFIMGLTGVRLVDVRRIRKRDFLFKTARGNQPNSMRAKVRYGKTIKTTTKAWPVWGHYDKSLIRPPTGFYGLQQTLEACNDEEEMPFECLDTSVVGAVLRDLRPEGMEVTTRCFRKHFAARAFAESGGDPKKVSERLGHDNLRMGGAFYLGLDGDDVVDEYCQHFGYQINQ